MQILKIQIKSELRRICGSKVQRCARGYAAASARAVRGRGALRPAGCFPLIGKFSTQIRLMRSLALVWRHFLPPAV